MQTQNIWRSSCFLSYFNEFTDLGAVRIRNLAGILDALYFAVRSDRNVVSTHDASVHAFKLDRICLDLVRCEHRHRLLEYTENRVDNVSKYTVLRGFTDDFNI